MAKTSMKDIPLQEITIRKYESPSGLGQKELNRKFLLSIGLLQPGESRDVIVNIFELLLENKGKGFEPTEILRALGEKRGASAPNIRRQLRRLRDLKLVDKRQDGYQICESIPAVVENFIEPFVVKQTVERLKEYSKLL
jgi:DNA-binding transcriptional ArsR family regulator